MKPKMITRVTTTEFETDDGVIHDIPFDLGIKTLNSLLAHHHK